MGYAEIDIVKMGQTELAFRVCVNGDARAAWLPKELVHPDDQTTVDDMPVFTSKTDIRVAEWKALEQGWI